MTSYNPLPSHLKAVQEEFGGPGMNTPTYGGTVETGAEWDFVIDKHGRKRCVISYGTGWLVAPMLMSVGRPQDRLIVPRQNLPYIALPPYKIPMIRTACLHLPHPHPIPKPLEPTRSLLSPRTNRLYVKLGKKLRLRPYPGVYTRQMVTQAGKISPEEGW